MIYLLNWATESGDQGTIGYWTEKPSLNEQRRMIYQELPVEEFTYDIMQGDGWTQVVPEHYVDVDWNNCYVSWELKHLEPIQ